MALHSILDNKSARKFFDVVTKLRAGNFAVPGMRIERLRTKKGKVYSARLNIEMRIIFSMYTDAKNKQRSLVLWDANHHDEAYDRVERAAIPAVFEAGGNFLEPEQVWSDADHNLESIGNETPDSDELTNGLLLFKLPHFVLSEPERFRSFEKNIDRYLRLSEEQEELLQQADKAYLIRGAAGTGKTSLALFHALNLYEQNEDDNVYFFTYHEELACVCRCYAANLVEDEHEASPDASGERRQGELKVFSYVEFCRHFLRTHPQVSQVSWQWVDRERSIKHLSEIIATRPRWARTFQPQNIYSLIYSILKGRLVPGTDKLPASAEDFRRIFRGYGNIPSNLEDVLEIFGHYEERLSRAKQKDEADLIRYCYQTFKEKAVLSDNDRATWIVIDEIQDFTELEWKSLLLFWENERLRQSERATYPLLCGDRNQTISQSGFRWQEVDSYVENILREIHRSSALEKVQLHRNFRNSKQIFDLGVFIHGLAPQAGADIGLPPDLPGHQPRLVVGSEDDFGQFLSLVRTQDEDLDSNLPAPLVILSEDETALVSFKEKAIEDDGVFFMGLQASKGLEFEDVIAYRLFSSLKKFQDENFSDEDKQRLFDLWYMAIMRARQNLLIYLTPDDLDTVELVLGPKYAQLLNLVDVQAGGPQPQLLSFYHSRERYLPNYAVIFLERTKANELFDQFRLQAKKNKKQAQALREKAFKLWHRCRDYESIGKAHLELGEYDQAIPFLQRACLYLAAAQCHEHLGRYETAAQLFEQEGSFKEAARCYEKCKQYGAAAAAFERMEEWLQAATNYYLFGDNAKAALCFEKAKMWQSAADLYKLKSNWAKAAELYQKCDQFELAGDMYLKLKDKLDAARCYEKAEMDEKAASLFEGLMRWAEAANCYEQNCQWDKAGALYSKAGRLKDAARCKELSGDLASAATAYERMRNWPKAAQAYLGLKRTAKAAECFEADENWDAALDLWAGLGQWRNAARCLERLGKGREAAECYAQAGLHNDAGHCYEKEQSWAPAADEYLKANNYNAAASMLTRLGRRLDAARLYLLAGQPQIALEVISAPSHAKTAGNDLKELVAWAESSGKHDMTAGLYEALNEFEKAIAHYKQAMKLGKAAECAEKGRLFEVAGDLYLQDGKFDKAAQCFKMAQQIKRAAQCYEMLKKWSEARTLYEEINDLEGVQRCESASNWL